MTVKKRAIERFRGKAGTAVIVGSGLSTFFEGSSASIEIDYSDFGVLPTPTVEGHPGRALLYHPQPGKAVCVFMGRSHIYEGVSMTEAGAAAIVAAEAGCERLLLVNAAGGLRSDIPVGSWLVPSELLVLPFVRSVMPEGGLPGGNLEEPIISTRFREEVIRATMEAGVRPFSGVLMWNSGPCYETASEARVARIMGADAVTMSVLPELTAACRFKIDVAVLSWVTNHTSNIDSIGISHSEVIKRARKGGKLLRMIIDRLIS